MKLRIVVSVVFLEVILCLATMRGPAMAAGVVRSPGGRGMAYIHDLVQEQSRQNGEARVIVVLGDPSLPQAWARDWRERGPAIGELTRRAQAQAPHFRVRRQYQAFPFIAGAADKRALDELARSSVVEAIYPDREHHAVLSESGPLIGQPEAELGGYDGLGIGIAVIDTGVDYTHPDLGGGGFPNSKVVGGYDFANSDANPMDDNGHGTYTSGIAAGDGPVYRGIAPKASIIALKVLDSTGLGYSSDIISALDWCVSHRVEFNIKVANLSLSDSAEWRDPALCDADPEGQAINDTVASGIVIAVASGNEQYIEGVGMPACVTGALAVGATWDAGPGVDAPAYFSNRGELLKVYAPGIWITAPAWSGDPDASGGYLTGAGTSSAAPHAAGAAADVFQMIGATATPADVAARLMRTGVQIVDPATGVGTPRIALARAMNDEPTSGPDLVVTAVSGATSSGIQGDTISVSVTVRNQGDQASTACRAVVALSVNRLPSPQDGVVASLDVPALAVGVSWSSGAVNGSVPGLLPRSYSLVAFADSEYQVSEKDETNNGRVGSAFTVRSLSAYVVSSTIPASMQKGQVTSVSVTIWNVGSTPWTTADGYALSAVSPLGNDRWGLSRVALPATSVPANGTATFVFTITAPSAPGLYPCHWQMAKGDQPFGEVASAASKTRVIDDTQWGQAYPAISGDWATYEDYSGLTGSAISVTNLLSRATATMPDDIPFPREVNYPYAPLPPYDDFDISFQMFPDVSGSWATWMVDDYPTNVWNYQITAQNAQDLNTLPLRITYQSADAMFPAIDGHLVVWEDYRNDPDGTRSFDFLDDNSDIYISDLSDVTGPDDHFPLVHPLCTAPGPQFAPRISGSLVVWEDWRDSTQVQSDIYLYDLSVDSNGNGTPNWKESVKPNPDPAQIRLTDTSYPEEFPDISGRTAVWMDFRRDTGTGSSIDLYALDIDTPTAVAVATDPPTFRYHPRIDYPLVVWEDYSNDADGPSWGVTLADRIADNPDIDLHHLGVGFTTAIAASSGLEEWPDVSSNRVSYAKLRGVVSHTDPFGGAPYEWPVFNLWVQQLPPEGMTGVASFSDVPATFWAWKQIEAAVAHGVVQGYAGGTYQPTWQVTRDQMAVYIARALAGSDAGVPGGPATPTFSDVDAIHWAYRFIEYCANPAQDVVKGFEDGTYQPNQAVNRGQMAAYIGRAMAGGDSFFASYVPTGGPSFPDVAATFWAYKYVEYIANAAVVKGYADGNYHPDIVVTRDQMAVYVARAFGFAE